MMTGEAIINIIEVRKPELDAQLIAENVALQLERRVDFPARHEEVRDIRHEVTAPRGSASPAPAGSGTPRWPGRNGTAREGFPSTPCGPT